MSSTMLQLTVKSSNVHSEDVKVNCDPMWNIEQLKYHLQDIHPTKPAAENQRLIYLGKLLGNEQIIKDIIGQSSQDSYIFHLVCALENSRSRGTPSSVGPTEVTGLQPLMPSPPTAAGPGQMAFFSNVPQPDPINQQMLWWQHAYAQHYWSQYVQYLNSAGYSWPQVQPQSPLAVPQAAVQEPPVPAAEEPQAALNEANEGNAEGRDWLDWIYLATRLAVLLAIVVSYSSVFRVVVIGFVTLAIYFYQNAHFRLGRREINNNVAQQQEEQQDVPAESQQDEARDADGPIQQPANPSTFSVALSLLTGFFASLIPEVPAPEAL